MEALIAVGSLLVGWTIAHFYYRLGEKQQSRAFSRVEYAIGAIQKDQAIRITPIMAADTVTTLLDYHEPGVKQDSRKVATYARRIAEELQLEPMGISRIEFAAYLHNVGLIGVDYDVLNKPGQLTDEEWEALKNHVILGARIVENVDPRIAEIIRHHHERFDGLGYPDGLSNGAIPIGSRIIAAASTFVALTKERTHRAAFPPEFAVQQLRRQTGSSFDPTVISAFEKVLNLAGKG